MKTPIVDAHLHVWEMPSERYPWSPLRNMHPAVPATLELLLETMQQNGVDKAIIVQPSNYGYNHAYVTDCMARFPGILGGVALLDFRQADAPQRVAGLYAQGYRGVRLFLYHETDLSWVGPAIAPVMHKLAELNMILTVFGPWREMDRVRRLAHDHPTVRFVVDHLGHPEVERQETWMPVLQLADIPTVHIKVSDFPELSHQPYPFADVFPFVRQVYSAFGAQRMMWASNFPHILRQAGYGPTLRVVDAALPDLPARDREWIMGGTAATLWGLGG